MSGGIEEAGGAVTAGLAAGAIEGPSGRGGGDGPCMNCGTTLAGKYCHECGQPAHISRTLFEVLHDFLHGMLHLDTKAWRTFPMLAFRPGTLTNEYIHGRRARYLSPIAIFLFTLFTMFFVFAFYHVGPDMSAQNGRVSAGFTAGQSDTRRGEEGATWQDQWRAAVERGDVNIDMGDEAINAKVKKKLLNPDLVLYIFQQTAYKFAFLLVPITLPFLALMFLWRRGVTLFDHVTFSLYSLSFMSLLVVSLSLLSWLGDAAAWLKPAVDAIVTPAILLIPPAHIFFHLKGSYSLGWFSALWRTAFVLFFAAISLGVFFLLVLLLGVLG